MNLLRDDNLPVPCDFLLLDASGAVVARMRFLPDGKVHAFPDELLPAVSWSRTNQVLSITGHQDELLASFTAEGLDEKGRKLIWGNIRIGSLALEYCLREITAEDHFPKISLCICCKGRLAHLKETLLQNIRDNIAYPHLEIVLLNYHSTDGLEEWISESFREYIHQGVLSYYYTTQPVYFQPAHARNMAIRLATGDVVSVVDADNYTGPGYAYYLADTVVRSHFLVACRIRDDKFDPFNDEGCVGRFAMYKDVFLEVGGMDEEHIGWGYDDLDLYYRLIAKGYKAQTIPHRYARCIPHGDHERRKELEHRHIGRETTTTSGTCFLNSERSKARIAAHQVVVNDGNIGCGGVIRNLGESATVVHRRHVPRISLCLLAGDHTGQLHHTLTHHLDLTRFYPNLEVVVLTHGQNDPERLLDKHFAKEIASGRLVHYQVTEPYLPVGISNPVHLANLCLRLAKGDILVHASPDHGFSDDFATRLAKAYREGWMYSTTDGTDLIISRHLFYLAGGLNETLPKELAINQLLHRLLRHFDGKGTPAASLRNAIEDFGGGTVLHGNEALVISPHQFPKISFTTVCMGRLDHLKQTLPQNIADNADYPEVEFVLLDYSDREGLEDWVRTEMAEHLESGRLVYYRHPGQEVFRIAHAKNMAMRLATGEFLCNVDADNFTGHHFAFHIAERLQHCDFLLGCLTVGTQLDSYCDQGMAGRVALARWLFYRSGGFDEEVTGWGYDDIDFYQRLRAMGYRGETIESRFLRCLAHGDAERAAHTGPIDIGGTMRANEGTARTNRERSERHLREGRLVLNAGVFGTGEVYRNFSPVSTHVRPFTYQKISFYTTSMGRLHHLCQTLPRNIKDNESYPHLEFVLLDYNSRDGLEKWARQHLAEHIDSGRLVYYKYAGREYFDRCHARNLAARVASGDILCNIDADNFTGADFAHYINERFSHSSDIFLRPDFDGAHSRLRDAFGRLCVRKSHFHAIEGYDEKFVDYGYEDNDICSRLEKAGIRSAIIEDSRFLRYIPHTNITRMENGMRVGSLLRMLVGRYPGQEWETCICLFEDHDFFCFGPQMTVISEKGRWETTSSGILLQGKYGVSCTLIKKTDGQWTLNFGEQDVLLFSESNDMPRFLHAYFNHSLAQNEQRFKENQERRIATLNEKKYGLATVFRNFTETPIQLHHPTSLERST